MIFSEPILSTLKTPLSLFLLPLLSALIICFSPKTKVYALSLILSVVPIAFFLFGYNNWTNFQMEYPWIESLGVTFSFKITSLSLVFLFLTLLAFPISFLGFDRQQKKDQKSFFILSFVLESLLVGFFSANDLVLFTFFWEAMLIPLYILINNWGREGRHTAAMNFLIYTVTGSAFMVAAVLSIYFMTGTFAMDKAENLISQSRYAPYLCAIFCLAFAVKTPLFPFHGWLPSAYYEASTPTTILLSSIVSKAGIYGFLRVVIPFFTIQLEEAKPFLLLLAVTGVLYGAFAAWMQTDFKRLLIYSSFSHVNFILAGLFIQSEVSTSGAILQAFNHGITIAALFLVASWLEQRIGTLQMNRYSGLALYMPKLCWITLFFVLSSIAFPGLNNFVGEILILFGFLGKSFWWVPPLTLATVFSAIYMLRWMQKIFFETPSAFNPSWKDLNTKELIILSPSLFFIALIGVYPNSFLSKTNNAAEQLYRVEHESSIKS